MELSIYNIIKRPLVTTKSVDLYKKLGLYTFEVHTSANKVMIREAVQKLWNVEVDKVRVITIPGKIKTFNRKQFETANRKKALVTLKKGFKIELPGMFESMASTQPQENAAAVEE